jgi:hypothetical protein
LDPARRRHSAFSMDDAKAGALLGLPDPDDDAFGSIDTAGPADLPDSELPDRRSNALGEASTDAVGPDARMQAGRPQPFPADPALGGARWRHVGGEAGARVVGLDDHAVSMCVPGLGVRNFHFAHVFDGRASQRLVYEHSALAAVQAVLDGRNACVLCYGQTGSGKTHTMFGPDSALRGLRGAEDILTTDDLGLVLRASVELVEAARQLSSHGVECSLTAQFVEIYNEQASDLLSGRQVQVRSSGLLQGAVEAPLRSVADVLSVLQAGRARQRFAATAMNERSSRAHSALLVTATQRRGDALLTAQLTLVDLAGSERVKKSKAQGGRLVEAIGING